MPQRLVAKWAASTPACLARAISNPPSSLHPDDSSTARHGGKGPGLHANGESLERLIRLAGQRPAGCVARRDEISRSISQVTPGTPSVMGRSKGTGSGRKWSLLD